MNKVYRGLFSYSKMYELIDSLISISEISEKSPLSL